MLHNGIYKQTRRCYQSWLAGKHMENAEITSNWDFFKTKRYSNMAGSEIPVLNKRLNGIE